LESKLTETTEKRFNFFGQSVTIVGQDIELGQLAPDFNAQAFDWTSVDALAKTEGKIRIIGSLPSLNTPICDKETRKFNEIADVLGLEVVIIMVSMDLPWTQKHWCTASRVDQVLVLSDHINADFGIKYGVLLEEPRVLRRAIFIVDKTNVVRYVKYMPSLGDEPDYGEVLKTTQEIIKSS